MGNLRESGACHLVPSVLCDVASQRVPLCDSWSSDLGAFIFLGSAKGLLNTDLKSQQVHGAN